MKNKMVVWSVGFLALLMAAPVLAKPKLVVIVVVDQLQPALLVENQVRFDPQGGFSRFLDQGLYYREAHVDHALSLTAPGHASIATGATPSQHGITGNFWFDREQNDSTSSVSDSRERILGVPTSGEGVSPRKLMARTLSDELILSNDGRSKVIAVSGKDRGAVFIAGFNGQAYWYSTATGTYVTSTYYFDKLPRWVRRFNKQSNADMHPPVWELSHAQDFYSAVDDRPYERPQNAMGRTFPHDLGEPKSREYYSMVKRVPIGDELTLKFAMRAVAEEELGKDDHTDLLSVSLSATDYVGHDFGPRSLEAQDNLVRLDGALGRFMDDLEQQVAAQDIIYVLTADHAVDANPEYRKSLGLTGYRLDIPVLRSELDQHLRNVYGTDEEVARDTLHTGVYFTKRAIEQFSLEALQRETIDWLEKKPAIEEAVVLPYGHVTDDYLDTLVQKAIYPGRMGDVFILPAQATFFGWPDNAAMHGTPYQYDRHIPLIFLLPSREGRDVWTVASQRSIVPTLARIMGVTKPSHASEPALVEVFGELDD